MTKLILATENYSPLHGSSIMAAKLFSMKSGIPLKIVDSNWLLKVGFKPYVPTFLMESDEGSFRVIKVGCCMDHWRTVRQLESVSRDPNFT